MKPLSQYITRTEDSRLLRESSSGGAFSELAHVILQADGVVIGAGWDENWNVIHKVVDNENGLDELRGSKYAFSDLSGVMSRIRGFLTTGREVLFVGTPCQAAAVRKLCGTPDNLYVCALICQSCAPSALWHKYVKELESKFGGKISSVKFRDKSDLLLKGRMLIGFSGTDDVLSEPLYENAYMRATGLAARDVCLACQFRAGRHGADLQIGDCWGVEKMYPAYADCKGASVVLIYSHKGDQLIHKTSLKLIPAKYGDVLAHNPYLEVQFTPDPILRERFLRANRRFSVEKSVVYAYEGTLLVRVVRCAYLSCRHAVGCVLRRVGLK